MTIAGKFGDPRTERDILSAKRFNFFSLIVLIVVIAAAFLLYLQLLSQQRELEIKTKELADSTANLRRIRGELEAAQMSLSNRQVEMEQQLQDISTSIENDDFDSAKVQANVISEQLAQHDSAGLTLIHLYNWQPQPRTLHNINNYLKDPKFILVKQETLYDLPAWMGRKSAVYYYSAEAAPKATEIAHNLSRISGLTFEAVPGNKADAPPPGSNEWIHIHYLGASLPRIP
jgi:hypothetical protein